MVGDSGALIQLNLDEFVLFEGLSECCPNEGEVYAPGFFTNDKQQSGWFKSDRQKTLSCAELGALVGTNWSTPSLKWSEPNLQEFEKYFKQSQAKFQTGELEKIVPVVFAEALVTESSGLAEFFLHALANGPRNTMAYAFWREGDAIFGLTPELLFDVSSEGKIETMALAGTRPLADDERKPLLQDEKELKEHRFVVDAIVRKLTELGTVELEKITTMDLPTLQHLCTRIELLPKNTLSFSQLVYALHPTPALGGVPAAASWQQLQKWNETRPRHRFGAPFGIRLDDGRGRCVVAIRCIQVVGKRSGKRSDQRLLLGSGCGLVSESELPREWDELSRKRQSVLLQMGLS